MISVSNEYKERILQDREFICSAKITLRDDTVIEVGNDNILTSGFGFDDGVSGNGTFDIGAAIINKFTLILDNTDMQYSEYDFTGAVIRPAIGLQLSSGIESFNKGVFIVDTAKTPGDTIKISALDNMSKFERDYDSALAYPATLGEIVRDACLACGVTLNTPAFDNVNYKVKERPTGDMTYLDAISYAAQIAGCYARCNYNGYLELKWYDFTMFEESDNLDGGHFIDYSSGSTADGGDFIDYSSGDSYDAGSGFDERGGYHHIYKLSSQDIGLDDVVITGIQAAEYSESTDDAVKYMYGSDGYVLGISGNPFIQVGTAVAVATFLGNKIIGTRFRPLTVSAQGDPSIEAGDMAYVSNRRGNSCKCCITNLSFSVGGWETYTCDAETSSWNNADSYTSALTTAIIKARENTDYDLSNYEESVLQLTELLRNSFGYYTTIEYDGTGAKTIYIDGAAAASGAWSVGQAVDFVYDGTYWRMVSSAGAVNADISMTTQSSITLPSDQYNKAVYNALTKTVTINFGTTLTLPATTWTNLFLIPAAYRPSGDVYVNGFSGSANVLGVRISSDGYLAVWSGVAVGVARGSIVYTL